jgi:hypothetical protein
MTIGKFEITGFSALKSGDRDYGFGVVRLDPRYVEKCRWGRHTLLRIRVTTPKGTQTTFAALRTIDPETVKLPEGHYLLALEYDDRLHLNVDKTRVYEIDITKAGLYGQYRYFRDHPNIVLRAYTRYTFVVGMVGAAIGALVTAALKFLFA